MRYIRVALPTDYTDASATLQLIVDTEASPLPVVIARVASASADPIVDALNEAE